MPTVTIEEAQNKLTELIHRLMPGEEVVITENDQPVARLVASAPPQRKPRQLGTLGGLCSTWPPTSTPRSTTSRSTWSEAAARLPHADLVRRATGEARSHSGLSPARSR